MEVLTKVYFGYLFISFYFLFLFLLLYIYGRRDMHKIPKLTKKYPISIVIPCYNEEENIGKTIENLVKNGYSNLKKIIIVDDRSTDNSYNIIKEYVKKYPNLVVLKQTPKNTGCAAGAKNYGAQFVKTELIGFTDADSFPEKGAIEKMMGFFDDKKMGAVTASIFVYNRDNFILKLQAMEYIIIKFSRKLMEFIDAIFVTPGPLVAYRTKVFNKIGRFDVKNLTEDVEFTWRLISKGYKVKMGVPARVYTVAPHKFKDWFNQRIRWNLGGIQSVVKYRKHAFKKDMLGQFILPMFVFYWISGLVGMGIVGYRLIDWVIVKYLTTTQSIENNVSLVLLSDFKFNPDILFMFGIVVFFINIVFTVIALLDSKEKEYKRHGIFVTLFYMVVYLMAYPFLLIVSLYKLAMRKTKW